MKHGIIIKNITDLRARPEFHSERKSQLLFNEPVKIGKFQNGYYRVIQPDGYFGWVSENAVKTVSETKLKSYLLTLKYRVKEETAKISNANSSTTSLPEFLFYGTKISSLRKQSNYSISKDPDGNSFRLSNNNLKLAARPKIIKPAEIIKEAKRFLGVPYLWGGIGPFGFDCSGFVRTIYRTFNIELSRDSRDQFNFGQKIAVDKIKPADLLFFNGHVAIAIGKDKFIHASLGEGGVAINSLNPEDMNFRKDLHETFLGARRVLP